MANCIFMQGNKFNGGGRIYPAARTPIAWGEWKRCVMIRSRESITGKQIYGFGWMRKEGLWEDPDAPGYYMGRLKQYAKNRKEIFKFKLTDNKVQQYDIRN